MEETIISVPVIKAEPGDQLRITLIARKSIFLLFEQAVLSCENCVGPRLEQH